MQPETFRAAMLNALRIGSYDTPHLTSPPVQEWLLAARSGPGGVFLMISDRAIPVDADATLAPDDQSRQNSIVAKLAEERADALQFRMEHHLPATTTVPGFFSPAEGICSLGKDGEQPRRSRPVCEQPWLH